jgi:hypothetical protein
MFGEGIRRQGYWVLAGNVVIGSCSFGQALTFHLAIDLSCFEPQFVYKSSQ